MTFHIHNPPLPISLPWEPYTGPVTPELRAAIEDVLTGLEHWENWGQDGEEECLAALDHLRRVWEALERTANP